MYIFDPNDSEQCQIKCEWSQINVATFKKLFILKFVKGWIVNINIVKLPESPRSCTWATCPWVRPSGRASPRCRRWTASGPRNCGCPVSTTLKPEKKKNHNLVYKQWSIDKSKKCVILGQVSFKMYSFPLMRHTRKTNWSCFNLNTCIL